ncbi:MAG: hypothetical protein B7C24_12330 [Bacteroidetes bacterium 4572_77]|nr:MAG: hypothetical protein B7C24_12330 [Bacteroidetes bacterium 4572_77]
MKQVIELREPTDNINCPNKLFDKIKKVNINYDRENLILFTLNTKNQLIDTHVIAIGGLNYCVCDPKVIFRTALLDNANSFIMAHNHPSGNLSPSSEDRKYFDRIKTLGESLTLNCLDSIIFNENEYYAMR